MAHILVVEDEADLRDLIRDVLQADGHTVMTAADGLEALVYLRHTLDGTSPFALVICDIRLPEMSGLSVCDFVRLTPNLAHIPFLFLSALGDVEQRLAGMACGADDYLAKPFLLNELLERVNWLLHRPAPELADDFVTPPNPLEQKTLDDLLRDIVYHARSGTLHFLLNDGSRGQIAFREGRAATVVGNGVVSLEDQLRRLFTGQAKLFYFA